MKYEIKSIKHSESFDGTFSGAVSRAREINESYDPAFGTQIEDEEGKEVWTSEE